MFNGCAGSVQSYYISFNGPEIHHDKLDFDDVPRDASGILGFRLLARMYAPHAVAFRQQLHAAGLYIPADACRLPRVLAHWHAAFPGESSST